MSPAASFKLGAIRPARSLIATPSSFITFRAIALCSTMIGWISGFSFSGSPFTVTGVIVAHTSFASGAAFFIACTIWCVSGSNCPSGIRPFCQPCSPRLKWTTAYFFALSISVRIFGNCLSPWEVGVTQASMFAFPSNAFCTDAR